MVQAVLRTMDFPQLLDIVIDAPFYPGRADSHLYRIRCSPEEYKMWIFWEKTSGIFSVFNTLWFDSGYMFGVSLRGFLDVSGMQVVQVLPSRLPVVCNDRCPAYVLQLQLINKVVCTPVVRRVLSPWFGRP